MGIRGGHRPLDGTGYLTIAVTIAVSSQKLPEPRKNSNRARYFLVVVVEMPPFAIRRVEQISGLKWSSEPGRPAELAVPLAAWTAIVDAA